MAQRRRVTHELSALIVTAVGVCAIGCWPPSSSLAQSLQMLEPAAIIPLPNVSGRIDHLAYEPRTQRLFVAALGNDTVEVIDTVTNQHLRSLAGFHEPQGIAAVPEPPAVAVANGDTGTLQLVDAQTLQTRWTVDIGGDADNVRFDSAARRLYVAAEGGLFAVDPATGKAAQGIAFAGHPESFQLEANGHRAFANLPRDSQIVVADRESPAVIGRWPITVCSANYPLALDESAARLFVGCRRPAQLGVFDTQSGKAVTSTAIVGDTDDLFYDAPRHRLYVIGGDGAVDVLSYQDDRLRPASRVETRAGARTGLWVPARDRLYVAVPSRDGQTAEIRVFDAID